MSANPQPAASTERATPPGGRRSFAIMRPNELPPDVLRWSSAQEKGKLRRAWHLAVVKEYGTRNRLLRLAWAVFELAATDGFASAGDGYLAAETGLQLKNVQLGLTQLHRAGAIVRVHVPENGGLRRRIYLSKTIINRHLGTPQRRGYSYPPPQGGRDTPMLGGQKEEGATLPFVSVN